MGHRLRLATAGAGRILLVRSTPLPGLRTSSLRRRAGATTLSDRGGDAAVAAVAGLRARLRLRPEAVRVSSMNIEEIEAEALKLDPRAQLVEKLLESLETVSDQENGRLWVEEADRRDWDSAPGSARPAADVL